MAGKSFTPAQPKGSFFGRSVKQRGKLYPIALIAVNRVISRTFRGVFAIGGLNVLPCSGQEAAKGYEGLPMSRSSDARTARARAASRITDPERPALNKAGALSVISSLIWPLQAALLAWVIAGWAEASTSFRVTILAAAGFLTLGVLRAALDRWAQGILFAVTDRVIAKERADILAHEAQARSDISSASLAALLVQKLPLLGPWISRYRIAILRVMVVSPVLLALVFWHSWAAGIALLIAGPLVPVFMAVIGIAADRRARAQLVEVSAMNDLAMERLSALLDLRLIGAAPRAVADFEARADGLRVRTMAVLRIAFLSSTVLELLAAIGVAVVAIYVGFSLLGTLNWGHWGHPLDLRAGLFILLLAPDYFQPLRDMAAAWHDRASGQAVADELDALRSAVRTPLIGAGGLVAPLSGPLSVQMRAVVADHGGHQVPLPDLSLRAGEAVAITGSSGAGKSTLLSVIAGLVPVARGHVAVCGRALDDQSADAWRARLAFVPQKPHFSGRALRDWLDPRRTGQDPWPALEQAGARALVEALPEGLDTRLGESGGGVSGGEARRLLIARAILAGGDLVIADEPTADLDPDTAERVIATLVALKRAGTGLLIATHDPRVVRAMDRSIEVGA